MNGKLSSNHGSRNVRNGFSEKGEPVKSSNAFHASGSSPTGESVSSPSSLPAPDFLVENHGSIFLLKPQTTAATFWLEEHIGRENGYQPYWPTCVVEHRFIADIVAGIQGDGLAVA
jgi:hypothetical protein